MRHLSAKVSALPQSQMRELQMSSGYAWGLRVRLPTHVIRFDLGKLGCLSLGLAGFANAPAYAYVGPPAPAYAYVGFICLGLTRLGCRSLGLASHGPAYAFVRPSAPAYAYVGVVRIDLTRLGCRSLG